MYRMEDQWSHLLKPADVSTAWLKSSVLPCEVSDDWCGYTALETSMIDDGTKWANAQILAEEVEVHINWPSVPE